MPNTAAPPLTVDDLDSYYGAPAPTTTTLIPTQTEAAPSLSVADLDKHFSTLKVDDGSPSPTPALDAIAKGFKLGAGEITSKPAELLAKGAENIGLTGLLNRHGLTVPTYAQQVAGDASDTAAGENALAGSTPGQVGKFLGKTAVVAPLISAGGAAIGAAGDTAANALVNAAPTAGKVIQGTTNFLTGAAGAGTPGAAGLVTRAASRAAAGAGAGGTAAAMTGGNVLQGAGTGALLGGVALPVAGSVLGAAGRMGGNLLAPITDLSPSALSTKGARVVLAALQKDGVSASDAQAALTKLGPQATLADVGGTNVRSMGEQVAMGPGSGSQTAQATLEGRSAGAQQRINDAIKDATGATGNIHADADALIAQRAQAAAPLYDIALAQDKNPVFTSKLAVDPRLAQFANDPIVQQGMQRGAEVARLNALAKGDDFDPHKYLWNTTPEVPPTLKPGTVDPSTGAKMTPDTYTPGTPPQTTVSMNALDAAKRGMDDILEQYRDPVTGKLNLDQRGKAINDVRSAFVKHLDSINPDYAAARAAYAGPSQSLDAMNMGKRALSNDPEVTSKIVGNLSEGDKQFYLNGVTRALQNKIESTQDGADATRKIFGNTLIRNKIAAAFDDPDKFQAFQQKMEAEAKFAQTRNELLKGSQTGRRMAGNDAAADFMPHLMSAATGDFRSGGLGAIRSAQNYLMKPSEQRLGAQANYLFGPGQQSLDDAVKNASPSRVRRILLQAGQQGKNALIPAATIGYQQALKGN